MFLRYNIYCFKIIVLNHNFYKRAGAKALLFLVKNGKTRIIIIRRDMQKIYLNWMKIRRGMHKIIAENVRFESVKNSNHSSEGFIQIDNEFESQWKLNSNRLSTVEVA